MSDVDFPTTGGWGQTDKQWKDERTGYEKAKDAAYRQRCIVNTNDQKIEAIVALLEAMATYRLIEDNDMTTGERTAIERQTLFYRTKLSEISTKNNDARNLLKRLETNVYNYRQRR